MNHKASRVEQKPTGRPQQQQKKYIPVTDYIPIEKGGE
jgi:hypothetical protein